MLNTKTNNEVDYQREGNFVSVETQFIVNSTSFFQSAHTFIILAKMICYLQLQI